MFLSINLSLFETNKAQLYHQLPFGFYLMCQNGIVYLLAIFLCWL